MKTIEADVLFTGSKHMKTDVIINGTLFTVQPGAVLPENLEIIDIETIDDNLTIIGNVYVSADCELEVGCETRLDPYNISFYDSGCPDCSKRN